MIPPARPRGRRRRRDHGPSGPANQGVRERLGGLNSARIVLASLACTQIELLIGQADSPVPVFPTTRLHVAAAIAASIPPGPLAVAR